MGASPLLRGLKDLPSSLNCHLELYSQVGRQSHLKICVYGLQRRQPLWSLDEDTSNECQRHQFWSCVELSLQTSVTVGFVQNNNSPRNMAKDSQWPSLGALPRWKALRLNSYSWQSSHVHKGAFWRTDGRKYRLPHPAARPHSGALMFSREKAAGKSTLLPEITREALFFRTQNCLWCVIFLISLWQDTPPKQFQEGRVGLGSQCDGIVQSAIVWKVWQWERLPL